jgi:acetylornithine/succinyldiaminopimelate/putrescine aminotransferase
VDDVRSTIKLLRRSHAEPSRALDKPALLHWREAYDLPWEEIGAAFVAHLDPGLHRVLRRLGYDSVRVVEARGARYRTADGADILDFWGGFGTFNLGHNHPRLAAVRRELDEAARPELAHAFVSAQAAVYAKNLAAVLPDDLSVSYLCCTGSEAVEAALKLAQKAKKNPRGRILYADGAMHGKTHGALSVTGNERVRAPFRTLPGCVAFPYGDVYALERALGAGAPGAAGAPVAVIVEPVQSGAGVVVPPAGYLRRVRELCDRSGAVLIVDEVQTGFGRTGRLFAFQHDAIVPDVITLSKAMGGGKEPIAACVSRRSLQRRAYGSAADATLHNATFNGMASATAVATEVLHVLYDEGLIDNARRMGALLLRRLEALQEKHPDLLVDVRGKGLLVGVELRALAELLPIGPIGAYLPKIRALGEGALAALVATRLLRRHGVLVAFTDFDRNVLRLEPPLSITEADVDRLVEGLSEALSLGVTGLVKAAFVDRWNRTEP